MPDMTNAEAIKLTNEILATENEMLKTRLEAAEKDNAVLNEAVDKLIEERDKLFNELEAAAMAKGQE